MGSGGGGNGGGGGSGGGGMFADYTNPIGSGADCANISFPATLKRVEPLALAKVQEGDLLPIQIRSGNICEVLNNQGEPCGIVIAGSMNDLAKCIEEGYTFQAAILRIQDQACEMRVENAK